MVRTTAIVSIPLLLLTVLAACGGDPTTAPESGSKDGSLSANNARRDELEAVFEAAGIENAAQWAREVEEYRPYPEDDTEFTKLRQELSKYRPGPGVVDAIVALLELP